MHKFQLEVGGHYAAQSGEKFYEVVLHEWVTDRKKWRVSYPGEPLPGAPDHLRSNQLTCEWDRLDDWQHDRRVSDEVGKAMEISMGLQVFDMALGTDRDGAWLDYNAAKSRASAEAYASLADVSLAPDDIVELRYDSWRPALVRPEALTRIALGFARKHRDELPALLDGPLMADGGTYRHHRQPRHDYSDLYRSVPEYVEAMRLAKSWLAEVTPHGPEVDGRKIGADVANLVGHGLNAHPNSQRYRVAWQTWSLYVGLRAGALGYTEKSPDSFAMFSAAMEAAEAVRETFPES